MRGQGVQKASNVHVHDHGCTKLALHYVFGHVISDKLGGGGSLKSGQCSGPLTRPIPWDSKVRSGRYYSPTDSHTFAQLLWV